MTAAASAWARSMSDRSRSTAEGERGSSRRRLLHAGSIPERRSLARTRLSTDLDDPGLTLKEINALRWPGREAPREVGDGMPLCRSWTKRRSIAKLGCSSVESLYFVDGFLI